MERATEWLRRWYIIGGKARLNWRGNLTLIDRRHDESVSFPLMDELSKDWLKEQVKAGLRVPPPPRPWAPKHLSGPMIPEDISDMPWLRMRR